MDAEEALDPAEDVAHPAGELVVEPLPGVLDAVPQPFHQLLADHADSSHPLQQPIDDGTDDLRQASDQPGYRLDQALRQTGDQLTSRNNQQVNVVDKSLRNGDDSIHHGGDQRREVFPDAGRQRGDDLNTGRDDLRQQDCQLLHQHRYHSRDSFYRRRQCLHDAGHQPANPFYKRRQEKLQRWCYIGDHVGDQLREALNEAR